jgi:hypothetical protein
MRARRLTTILASLAGAAVLLPMAAGAAPKPGFAPGVWVGSGEFAGRSTIEGPPSDFSGNVTFRLTVGPDGKVTGQGRYRLKMTAGGEFTGQLTGTAPVKASGTATNAKLAGVAKVAGSIGYEGVEAPISFSRPVTVRLQPSRAGHCKVQGRSTFIGVTLRWTAQLAGSGTCLT